MLLPIGDDNPNERTPIVHYGILGANVVVFLYMLTLSGPAVREFLFRWGLVPAEVGARHAVPVPAGVRVGRAGSGPARGQPPLLCISRCGSAFSVSTGR